ncbi:hypothetical protein QQO53_16425 [Clostridioides difficile]|uniref:hypothetical protein n=1 Tax=Clostridioides difficile TaxID=1496 RepID=UPI00097FD909|nr:hypothetical protein [Clostridioides difficile]EJA6849119.1 hypothetical protein [Clostridioides difficile]MDL0236821.1 hypothetical protein [Clostridioides difficile]SJQ13904.1 Uncharacterised protein [Clostridioides difficile]SJW58560.1 Uncharacterised protein [Clostridioides difficile]HBF2333045.1 hypothetical protein [Clostridioides difficile]
MEKKQTEQLTKISENNIEKFKNIKEEIDSHTNAITNSKQNLENNKREINNLYTNLITILGLFSAIVITFFGGLSTINGILSNMDSISKYRLIFIILLMMFAMFNIIFLLLYYVSALTGKRISKNCEQNCEIYKKQRAEGNNHRSNNKWIECKNKKILCSKQRYPLIFYFDLLNIILLLLVCIAYYLKI